MSRGKFLASIAVVLMLNACGSSGGGGTGGGAGQSASGGAGGHGSGGSVGTGGAGGNSATGGAGGGSAGAGGGTTGTGGKAGAGGGGAGTGGGTAGAGGGTGGSGGAGATCGDSTGPSVGESCNTLTAGGSCVQETLGNGNVPTASGGTLAAGTYDLMSRKLYTTLDGGVTLSSEVATIMLSSVTSTSLTLDTLEISGSQVQRASGPVTISGTNLTFAPTCPAPGDGGNPGNQGGTVGFTANGATLTIIQTSSQGTTVSIYNKH